jgi:hypothetical protein
MLAIRIANKETSIKRVLERTWKIVKNFKNWKRYSDEIRKIGIRRIIERSRELKKEVLVDHQQLEWLSTTIAEWIREISLNWI